MPRASVVEARNDPRWNAAGLASTAFISFLRGRFTEARAYYEDTIGLWDPSYWPSVCRRTILTWQA